MFWNWFGLKRFWSRCIPASTSFSLWHVLRQRMLTDENLRMCCRFGL